MPDEAEEWLKALTSLGEEDRSLTEKQINILKAAVDRFVEKGYAATSTSEIAQKAGVAEGTIFRHYKTKKDLLLAIVTPVMARFVAPFVLRDLTKLFNVTYPTYADFVRAVFRNRYEFVKKHLPILRILVQEIPFHPELREPFIELAGKHVYDKVRGIVEHFQQKGELIDLPPPSVIRMTVSVGAGFLVARFLLLPDADWDDEAELERSIEFMMYGLVPRP